MLSTFITLELLLSNKKTKIDISLRLKPAGPAQIACHAVEEGRDKPAPQPVPPPSSDEEGIELVLKSGLPPDFGG